MHINAFFMRGTASGDLVRLFGAGPSASSAHKKADATPHGSSVTFLARFDSTLPVGHRNAIAKIIDILAAQNPGAPISGIADIHGSLVGVAAGTDGADTIAYAGGGMTSRPLTAYIDARGGDDVISFASNVYSSHDIDGGDGNDAIAASAPWFGTVNGGSGDDAVAVAGEYIPMVNGGSGNDTIAVTGRVVSNVDGGTGDDVIAVSADYVVAVSGGDGNDTITVTSENRRYFGGGPDSTYIHGVKRPVMIEGGKGNDTISIGGEGYVIFQVGGGQDVVTISDRTEFELKGKVWDDFSFNVKTASFTHENGALVVTFAGRDETLTIQSPFGEVKVEVTGSQSFVVTPA